jgi:hypothetical protein
MVGRVRDGQTIDELVQELRAGLTQPHAVPPIRLVRCGKDLFTLDNRRLEAFRRAGIDVPYRMVGRQEALNEAWKHTTRVRGRWIRIRNG